MISLAQKRQLEEYNNGLIAKQNYADAHSNRKVLTQEQLANIDYQVALINSELSTYEYILYQQMQDIFLKIEPELVKCNLFRHNVKNIHNKAKAEIDALCSACRTSENLEFMALLTSSYDRYRNDYMKEGGIYFNTICYKYSKYVENDMTKLHYSTRMALINSIGFNAAHSDLATQIYKLYCLCLIADEVVRFEKERIYEKCGVRVPIYQNQWVRYEKFKGAVKMMRNMFCPPSDKVPKSLADQMQLAGQIVLNKLVGEGTAIIVTDAIAETIKDYAYYCVARMLMDVRTKGSLCLEDIKMLKANMNMTNESINDMTKELKRTRIDISSGDAYEIKDFVPCMSKAKVVKDVFLKSLSKVIEEELNKAV